MKTVFITAGIILLILLGVRLVWGQKIYFYKTGTYDPIANTAIKLTDNPACSSSGCVTNKLIFQGYTDKEGAIWLSWPNRTKDLYEMTPGEGGGHRYWVELNNFRRPAWNDYTEASPDRIYLTEAKNPDRAFIITTHGAEEFTIPLPSGKYSTLKFLGMNEEKTAIQLGVLLDRGAIERLTLAKDKPSYIPGEITDTQLALDAIDESNDMITMHLIPTTTMRTWSSRPVSFKGSVDRSTYYFPFTYDDALSFFKKKSEQYHTSFQPEEMVDGTSLQALAVISEKENKCLRTSFNFTGWKEPLVGGVASSTKDLDIYEFSCLLGK